MNKRRISVVTGTRAEYGLLRPLMHAIENDADLELQLMVTAMHLSAEFGLTYKNIEQDGFRITESIESLISGDTPVSIAKSMGLTCIGFADVFARHRPDIVVLLGDRFELLAAAQAALVAGIPIAHIHGGELTEGAIDDVIRHAITKLAHLHFVAADMYRHRVIQLGEEPERVFTVGALGLDNIRSLRLLSRCEFETAVGFDLGDLCFLVTYHPVTRGQTSAAEGMQALLDALDEYPQAQLIISYPNADPAGRGLIEQIQSYATKHGGRVRVVKSLGQHLYLNAARQVDAVIGNSSSGIIEVPSLGKPTVNIGDRQKGRLRADSIVDCPEDASAITRAIDTVLSTEFQEGLGQLVNPYGDGETAPRILWHLKHERYRRGAVKRFFDIPFDVPAGIQRVV